MAAYHIYLLAYLTENRDNITCLDFRYTLSICDTYAKDLLKHILHLCGSDLPYWPVRTKYANSFYFQKW
jgi:hypothetical protein